ncbi:MAG: sigma-70 family RNA polymerase sigma factor [Isosphaerales bacterium]
MLTSDHDRYSLKSASIISPVFAINHGWCLTSDQKRVNLIRSFLAAPDGCASAAAVLAWNAFYRAYNPLIRVVVRKYAGRRVDVDDLTQEVWIALTNELPDFQQDPARGTLSGWVATVAHHAAASDSTERAGCLKICYAVEG